MDSQDTLQEVSQLNNLEQKDHQPDCPAKSGDSENVVKTANESTELQTSSSSDSTELQTSSSCQPVCSTESCLDVKESHSVNPVVSPVLELSVESAAVSGQDNDSIIKSDENLNTELQTNSTSDPVLYTESGMHVTESHNVNSVVTPVLELSLQNVSNQDSDSVIKNESIELQTGARKSQHVSICSLESCIDINVNLVVTPVPEVSLQDVDSSQDGNDLTSTIITTAPQTSVSCGGDKADTEVLMDVSISDDAVVGSGIAESSSLGSAVRSSTCSDAENKEASVDISLPVQPSDLSTSSDTHNVEFGSPELQLNPVCLQADKPVKDNLINDCVSDKINSSINGCNISQSPSESLEDDKQRGDTMMECEDGNMKTSIDETSVGELTADCLQTNQEHSNQMDDNDDGKVKNVVDDGSFSVENIIKQEPYDAEYERSDLIYRSGPVVVDSDDDACSIVSNNAAGDSDKDVANVEEVVKQQKVTAYVSHSVVRTEGEVFPEELPPLEYLTISPDASVVLEALGTVSGIVGVLVIVKANQSSPALYDDTVLFLEGRQPLGFIFEIFGTVEQPYYSVRFNTNKDIQDRGIAAGDKVFFAPKADNLTKYVFIAELRKIRCDDASWENDNEPPPAHLEYSDDEKERQAKQQQRNKDRVKDNDETSETAVRKKKRRKKPSSGFERDPNGPQLLQGDLNRNPFGNKNQTFSSSTNPRWPRSGGSGPGSNHRPRFPPQVVPQPQPPSLGGFRNQWPPQANFAERPGWNQQPGILGRIPDTASNGSPNMGHFPNNFSSPHFRQPHPGFGSPPFPPAPSHNVRGPNPHQPRNAMPPQGNMFGTYFPRGNMEHINTFAPPAGPRYQNHGPPGFPMFSPSHPPPVVNAMFNQHRPPHLHMHK